MLPLLCWSLTQRAIVNDCDGRREVTEMTEITCEKVKILGKNREKKYSMETTIFPTTIYAAILCGNSS
jgi:hypothetical protein